MTRGPNHPGDSLADPSWGGDAVPFGDVVPLVYDALRKIAHRKLAGERTGHTFATTELVHEAYLKLARLDGFPLRGRSHFLAIAAHVMRNVLVDYAVRRRAEKRGGRDHQRVTLEDGIPVAEASGADVLVVHDALERLRAIDERQSHVVECRFFAGMSIEETAEALGVSAASIKRDWALARAWLNRELTGGAV